MLELVIPRRCLFQLIGLEQLSYCSNLLINGPQQLPHYLQVKRINLLAFFLLDLRCLAYLEIADEYLLQQAGLYALKLELELV